MSSAGAAATSAAMATVVKIFFTSILKETNCRFGTWIMSIVYVEVGLNGLEMRAVAEETGSFYTFINTGSNSANGTVFVFY